jgi:acyl-CoA thioesterase FadM
VNFLYIFASGQHVKDARQWTLECMDFKGTSAFTGNCIHVTINFKNQSPNPVQSEIKTVVLHNSFYSNQHMH